MKLGWTLTKSKKAAGLAMISMLFIAVTSAIPLSWQPAYAATSSDNNDPCNCVIFRIDDIQDYFDNRAQVAVFDLFLKEDESLSAGVIMNDIGADQAITDKLIEGRDRGLFELSIHGWDHVDYSKLTEEEQEDTMIMANEKMQKLFDTTASMFIPPFNTFNDDTIKAMTQTKLRILSSSTTEDKRVSDYFVANGEGRLDDGRIIYHMPEVTTFGVVEGEQWIRIPNEEIIKAVDNSMAKYGYAVVLLHPQNFVVVQDGKPTQDVDYDAIDDLARLVKLFAANYKISTFEKVVESEPRLFTLTSSLDGKSYTITGKSADVKMSSFEINPNKSVKINTEGQGELELTLPKSMIGDIISITTDNQRKIQFDTANSDSASLAVTLTVPSETKFVEMAGTRVVPEYPMFAIMLFGICVSIAVIILPRLVKHNYFQYL